MVKSKSSSSSSKRSENESFVMLVRVGNLGPDCLSVVGVDGDVCLSIGAPNVAVFSFDGDLQFFNSESCGLFQTMTLNSCISCKDRSNQYV